MANIKFTDLPNLGNITPTTIVPVVDANVNYTVTAANLQGYVNTTTGNISAGNILASNSIQALANVTANLFIGDGSQLTGIVSSYGDANVAAYLPINNSNVAAMEISAVGNIVATGNITGAFLLGNGSQITGLPANYGNAEVASFLATFGSNTVSTTGNVTAGFLVGNISAATGGYGNANVQAVLQTYTGTLTAGSVSATGNIAGNFFVGNGSQLTGITSSLSGNLAGNINGNGFGITGLTVLSAATVSASGNVVGTHLGSGSGLTGIPTSILAGPGISVSSGTGAVTITNNNPTPYGNTQVAAFLPTYTGALTAASVSASGNVTASNLTGTHFGSGANLSNIVNSITAGTGISINASTGAVTITATGGGGGGTSIVNGNTNVRIDTIDGNIAANVNTYGNAMVFSSTASYPVFSLKSLTAITSQSGSYNTSLPFDGGLTVTGACQFAGGTTTLSNAGLFTTSIEASGTITGAITAGASNITTTSGQISSGTGGFRATQRTVAQGTTGTAGQIFWDANYIYVCTAANTWKRALLSSY